MQAVYNTRYSKPQYNPYPAKYRLPGDKSLEHRQLTRLSGTRAVIAQALTYHEIPKDVDHLVGSLPSNKVLSGMPIIQRGYLSFTVYALKQMLASGSISADSAWTIFYGEWDQLQCKDLCSGNFRGFNKNLFRKIRSETNNFGFSRSEVPLLEFEFIARAGQAGLDQYERFEEWSKGLVFIGKVPSYLKREYAKALWLEMRTIEEQIGVSDLYEDIERFAFASGGGSYQGDTNRLSCSVDLFSASSQSPSRAVDSMIKAEIGHWMFYPLITELASVDELMDRMNMSGFTERINDTSDVDKDLRTPEQKVWLSGGYYRDSRNWKLKDKDAEFPTYPDEFPIGQTLAKEPHIIAERIERLIRKRIGRAILEGAIQPKNVFATYKQMGLYIAILESNGKPMDEILKEIELFNYKKICRTCLKFISTS